MGVFKRESLLGIYEAMRMAKRQHDFENRMWIDKMKFKLELQVKNINKMSEEQAKYKTMSNIDFMERLIEEAEQLGERTNKLYQFIGSEKFEKVVVIQHDLLIIQLSLMKGYLQVLELRIKDLNRKTNDTGSNNV